jgi:hypothetical protein
MGTPDTTAEPGTLGMAAGLGIGAGRETAGDQGIGGVHLAEGRAGEAAGHGRDDQFSAWLRDRDPASRADDDRFSWLDPNSQTRQAPQTSWTSSGALASAESAGGGLAGQPGWGRTGIDLARGTASAAHAQPRASAERIAPAAAGMGASAVTGSAAGTRPAGTGSAAAGQPAGTGSAVGGQPAGTGSTVGGQPTAGIRVTIGSQPRRQRRRLLPLRLLVVVVVAALLGSVLVMLLK